MIFTLPLSFLFGETRSQNLHFQTGWARPTRGRGRGRVKIKTRKKKKKKIISLHGKVEKEKKLIINKQLEIDCTSKKGMWA